MVLILFSFIFFLNCQNEEEQSKKELLEKTYLKKLPKNESINASLYHYEIILERIKKNYQAKNYTAILNDYNFYLETFNEGRNNNENELNYWVGLSLTHLIQDKKFIKSIKANPREGFNYGIKINRQKEKLIYENFHFKKIISDRNNYLYEKKSIQKIYQKNLKKLQFQEKNLNEQKKTHQENFKQLNFLATRYPDFLPFQDFTSLLKDKTYIDYVLLTKTEKEKLNNIKQILVKLDESKYFPPQNKKVYFLVEKEIILRSRSHEIASRNLKKIELWQPFKILYSLIGEDGQKWYRIKLEDKTKGFIQLNKKVKTYPLQNKSIQNYLSLYQLYLDKKYLEVIEGLSKLINQQEIFLKERSLTFLNNTLDAIGRRSTSQNNIYTQFALKFPLYFTIYEKEWYLKSSDNILFLLLKINPHSKMLQYFEGFDVNLNF